MPSPALPSGTQFELTRGDQRAVVVEVGGGVRRYEVGDREVLHPYDRDAMCDGAHGAPLIPWPNRLADGRYSFDGNDYQVALTEPEKHNAIHGFLRWRSWQASEQSGDQVVMTTTLYPLTGYLFALHVDIEYALSDAGLTVRTTTTNVGDAAAPYACGQHPYLSPGSGILDPCTLRLDAATRIDTDDERQLPTGTEPVEGTAYDFRKPREIGDLAIDYAFKDLTRDGDGRAWARLTGTDGRTCGLWVDESYPYLEIYTADTLSEQRRRTGLGCEPMTGPPNALGSGTDVVRLDPGQTHVTTWGACLL
ncbi:MAG: aldose 1-epimerase family protein [Actinomycetes bacterium]